MKAVCFSKYGPPEVLELKTVDKPSPKNGEVLVRVYAATVTPGDCELRCFKFPFWVWIPLRLYMGVFRPRRPIIGMEFSGVVEAAGESVDTVRIGEAVFGGTGPNFGTYAEYRCQSASAAIGKKPANVSHAEAATISVGGLNALHYLRLGKIRDGDQVLINGAAGCFGTYAIQLAKHFGANVTGVDHQDKLEIMTELGADAVIDYTKEDFTDNGVKYDLILEVTGKASYSKCLGSLKPDGRLVLANPKFMKMLRTPLTNLLGRKKVSFAFAKDRSEDLQYVADLIASNTLKVVIDRSFPLGQIVEAHRYVESGSKIGQVVVQVAEP